MVCNRISYRNFRNIAEAELRFAPGTNLLFGSNAEGKTNALEGVSLFSGGRSFRGARDKELIRFGEPFSVLRLDFSDEKRSQTMEIRLRADGRKQLFKNGVAIRRLSEFVGVFRAVVFCPQHLSLVRDGPDVRRAFLDGALSQLSPAYLHHLQRYQAALSQRNALLRQMQAGRAASPETAEVWSEELARLSETLGRQREAYALRLNDCVRQIFGDMTGGRELPAVAYSPLRSAEEYRRLYRENLVQEIRFGSTLYGVHRDDLKIQLNGREAKRYASQGQQRSLALALKMAESELSRALSGERPVLLLDDILSELDESRQRYILSGLGQTQAIITSCDRSVSGAAALSYRVEKGSYTPVQRAEQ